MRLLIISISIFLFVLTSCQQGTTLSMDESEVVARVYDKYLHQKDLEEVGINHGREDSIEMVQNFIKNWTTRMLMLNEAEQNTLQELLEIDKQIEDYRTSLVIYAYEKELVRRNLDTVVNRQEIEQYYNQYLDNFELNNDLYNFNYVKIPETSPGLANIEKAMQKGTESTPSQLEVLCRQFGATDYSISDENWVDKNKIMSLFPLQEANLVSMSQNFNLVRMNNKPYVIFIRIRDMAKQGTVAPLEHVEDDIRKIIINKRRVKLLDNYYKRLYNKEINTKNIELYP